MDEILILDNKLNYSLVKLLNYNNEIIVVKIVDSLSIPGTQVNIINLSNPDPKSEISITYAIYLKDIVSQLQTNLNFLNTIGVSVDNYVAKLKINKANKDIRLLLKEIGIISSILFIEDCYGYNYDIPDNDIIKKYIETNDINDFINEHDKINVNYVNDLEEFASSLSEMSIYDIKNPMLYLQHKPMIKSANS